VTPQAIETSYAGCRFRSRLEARWAVFLTTAQIGWQYEAQGYLVGPPRDQRPYLPDFWLPELRLHAEVKGSRSGLDFSKLAYAARYLPGDGLLLLGNVPDVKPGWLAWQHAICFSGGTYWQNLFHFEDGRAVFDEDTGFDLGPEGNLSHGPSAFNFDAYVSADDNGDLVCATPLIAGAYAAARSARFEHGQSGPFRGGT
jgi:hypothetical protein